MGILAAVAGVVYVVDQVTKELAERNLSGRGPVEVVDGLLRFTLTYNPGAAFSIGVNSTWLFTLVAAVVVVVILHVARRLFSAPWAFALGLLLGGAVGNLTDRVLRAPAVFRGHVVDFIQLPNWPVFNVADMGIVCGGVLMVLLSFRGLHPDGTRDGDQPDGDRPAAGAGEPSRERAD